MSEDKNNLSNPSNHGAYNTAYTPPPPYSAPTNGYAAPANPGYSVQSGQEMVSNGPTTMPTTVTMQSTVTSNDMHRQSGPMPPNYIKQNVYNLIFCFLLFGILGLIKGNQVTKRYMSGNHAAAQEASLSARKWYKVGVAVGTFIYAFLAGYLGVYFLFY